MKYMHGTDENKHDIPWVLLNGMGACTLFVASCATMLLVISTFVEIIRENNYVGSIILLLLGGCIAFFALSYSTYSCLWCIARYQLSACGITVRCAFHTVQIPWENVKLISVHPVNLIQGPSSRDYIIVWLTGVPPLTDSFGYPLNLVTCRRQRKDFLSIRWTEYRLKEFGQYHGVSR